MNLLAGKVAVITGSSRGLGLAIAQAYAREGAAVVLSSRSDSAITQAVAAFRAGGAQATGRVCDVADLAQVQTLADHALNTFNRLDIWVNNAGVSAPYGPTVYISPEEIVRTVQTNILGTYYGSLVALNRFLPQGSGKLINLLGRGSREVVPMQNAYASSKAWIHYFTMALAKEHEGSGIGIFAFNPGLVITELLTQVDAVEGYEERVKPLRTVTRLWGNQPEVPAQKAVWLASAATDGRTGLEVSVLNSIGLLKGLLREGTRQLLRRTTPPLPFHVRTVPAVEPSPLPTNKRSKS
jgi:glucose 1-dehydrogenase